MATVEPIFEAISHCASLNADPFDDAADGDDDDAFLDPDGSAFDQFNGDEDELDEVGRVRSLPLTDARFHPY